MKTWLSVAMMLLSGVALADEPQRPSAAEVERHQRVMRTVMLADDLGLEPNLALQVSSAMGAFDDRRQAAMEQRRRADETLRSAAEGDASAVAGIDRAIQERFEAEARLQQLDREMLTAASKSLSAQQRAKLAQFVSHEGRSCPGHPDGSARPE